MAVAIGFDNAIGWAQLQLRRGWKNVLATTIAYTVVVGGLILGSLRLADVQGFGMGRIHIFQFWTMALMALQIAVLLLFGCSAVSSAIRKDITSKIIESHRLMNVSGTEAVAGYIFGATCQIMPVAAATLVLGSLTAQQPFGVRNWLLANVVLAVFALCAWTAMALLAFVAQAGVKFFIGCGVIFAIGHSVLPAALPGLSLPIGPFIRYSVFGMIALGDWDAAYEISIAAQFLVAVLCYVGAVRKYRRDDVLTFGPLLGLIVVTVWVGLSAVGISEWASFHPIDYMRMEHIGAEGQTIVGLLAGLVLATLPVSAGAWIETQWRRRRLLRDPALPVEPVPTALVVLVAALLLLLLPCFAMLYTDLISDEMLRTFLTIALFLLATSYLLRILYAKSVTRTRLLVGLWFFLTWLGPLGIDFALAAIAAMDGTAPSDRLLSPISSCSPIGALMDIWDGATQMTYTGLAVQAILAAAMAGLFHAVRRRTEGAADTGCPEPTGMISK